MGHFVAFFFALSVLMAAFHKGSASLELLLVPFLASLAAAALTFSRESLGTARSRYSWPDAVVIMFTLLVIVVTLTGDQFHFNVLGAVALLLLVPAYRIGRAVDDRAVMLCLAAVVVLGMVMSAVALHQVYRGQWQPNGLFPNRNNFGAYLVLSVFLLGALAVRLPQAWRAEHGSWIALGLLSALMFFLVALGGSRGAYLGALGGLAVLVLWAGRELLHARVFPALLLGALVGVVAGNLLGDEGRAFGERMGSLGDPGAASPARLMLYQGALELIREHPWLGWGPGMFMWVYPAIRLPAEGSAGFQVHNDYLAMAVHGGIALALVFLLVLATPVLSALRRRASEPEQRQFHGWLVAGLAAVSIHALFTFNYSMPPILLAVGLVLGVLARRASPMSFAPLRSTLHSLSAVAVLGVLAFGGYALVSLVGHRNVMLSQVAEERGNPAKALAYANEGVTWWPLADHAWGRRAEVIYRNVLKSETVDDNPYAEQVFGNALGDTHRAIELNPYRWQAHYLLGRLHIVGLEQDYEEASAEIAEAALKESLRRNPRYFSARLRLVDFYRERDREREALDLLLRGLQEPSRGDLRSRMLKDARELAEALDDAAALERLEAYEAESAETETDPEVGVGQLAS